MTANPEASVIADIDALVDEQLQQEASGYDHNINQDTCELCGGDWHGLPATARGETVGDYRGVDRGRYVGCPGAFATDEQRARWRRDHPAHIDETHLWTADDVERLRVAWQHGRRRAVERVDAEMARRMRECVDDDVRRLAAAARIPVELRPLPQGMPERMEVAGRQLSDRQRAYLNQWVEVEPPSVTVRGAPDPDYGRVLLDAEWNDTHPRHGRMWRGARIAIGYEQIANRHHVTPVGRIHIYGGWDLEVRAGGGDGVITSSVTAELLSPHRGHAPREIVKLPIQWGSTEERCGCGIVGPHLREQCEERHRARRDNRLNRRLGRRRNQTWRIDD
ncbi:hypothetical protein [Mycolicibacterium fortuitum]|uniref:hypothetical protein n=1 Tax=Mycolicibacterium fortuitum TaxID=1766 RepID=UPI002617E99E|nr:hypothetical protein [Mycolicibacterium fortuitum]